jgi:small-conductance mechanosensitive channel
MLQETIWLGNTLTVWLSALAVALGVYLLLTLLARWGARRLKTLAEEHPKRVPESAATWLGLTAGVFERFSLTFRVVSAVYAGSHLLSLPGIAQTVLWALFVIVVTAQAAVWVTYYIEAYLKLYMERRRGRLDADDRTTIRWVTTIAKGLVWIIAVLVICENLGVDVTALAAAAGIGGIAVALAVQNVMADFLASFSIVMDKPFVIGDFVVVNGAEGTVEAIGLKTTRIRSLSGEQIVFSNSTLLGSRLHNYGRMRERRVPFSFGVVHQTPADKLAAIPEMVREIIQKQERARFDRVHFKEYGDSSLDFEVVYFIESPDYRLYMDTKQEVNLGIFKRFEEEGIEFAYPTRTLYLEGREN